MFVVEEYFDWMKLEFACWYEGQAEQMEWEQHVKPW